MKSSFIDLKPSLVLSLVVSFVFRLKGYIAVTDSDVGTLRYSQLYNGSFGTLQAIDQFRFIIIQPNTIDLSTRLWRINPTSSELIPQSLVMRSIVLG